MSIAASVVTYTVAPENAAGLTKNVSEHLVPAAREIDGYLGFLLLDQGEDRRMAVLLFETIEQVRQAQQTLSPVGRDYTYALMSSPAIGSVATVLVSDGLFPRTST
jgi:hypothetical protein